MKTKHVTSEPGLSKLELTALLETQYEGEKLRERGAWYAYSQN